MIRNPPGVKRQIRQTDGFVCAYPDCYVPYLEYHHFDPPWNIEQHNNPDGIIGLCPTHHALADGGVFTKEQLRAFKNDAPAKFQKSTGSLLWLRSKVVLVTGGNAYMDNTYDIILREKPMIWFNTDINGNRLMNLDIPSVDNYSRIRMVDNDWEINEKPKDIECTPLGKKVSIEFDSGEFIHMEFTDIFNSGQFHKQFHHFQKDRIEILPFPHCLFSVKLNLSSIGLIFDSNSSSSQIGRGFISGGIMTSNKVGLSIR